MDLNELLAPQHYNLTEEIEKFSSEKIALKWQNEEGQYEEITYSTLLKKANQLANALSNLGLKKEDKVLIIVPRLIESYIIYLGCLKMGLVVIPASEMLRAKDLSYRINHGEVKAIISYYTFTHEVDTIKENTPTLQYKIAFGQKVNNWLSMEQLMDSESDIFAIVETKRDDIAFLTYTSGTTGQPKGVTHSHGWAYVHLRTAASLWLDVQENDTVWATAGPGWQKWVWSPFVSVLGKGATGFVYHGRFQPETYLKLMMDHTVNVLCCTPTEYRMMAKVDGLEQYDLSNLRSAVSAGEPLNRKVIEIFKKYFNITVRDGYGQTESTLLIGTLKDMKMKPGSMGKAILSNYIEILNDAGEPVPPGEIGNIAVRRDFPALFKKYYKDPGRTAKAYRGEYFLTGDRAAKDEEGYFWFEGRGDDIIISSGYTIGPFEVEDVLMKHPCVKECAVVASPDEIRGHVVKAFIVLKNGITGEPALVKELQAFVKGLTAPYKYPRIIEFVSDLPKTESGKIRRVELREREVRKYLL